MWQIVNGPMLKSVCGGVIKQVFLAMAGWMKRFTKNIFECIKISPSESLFEWEKAKIGKREERNSSKKLNAKQQTKKYAYTFCVLKIKKRREEKRSVCVHFASHKQRENMSNVKAHCQPMDDCGQIANYTWSNIANRSSFPFCFSLSLSHSFDFIGFGRFV